MPPPKPVDGVSEQRLGLWRTQNVVKEGVVIKKMVVERSRRSVRSVFYASLAIVRLVRFLEESKRLALIVPILPPGTTSSSFQQPSPTKASFLDNDEGDPAHRPLAKRNSAEAQTRGSMQNLFRRMSTGQIGDGTASSSTSAPPPAQETTGRGSVTILEESILSSLDCPSSDSGSDVGGDKEKSGAPSSSNVDGMRSMEVSVRSKGGKSIRESMFGLGKISAQLVRLQSMKRISNLHNSTGHLSIEDDSDDGVDGIKDEGDNNNRAQSEVGGGSPHQGLQPNIQDDEFDGYSFGTSASDDEEGDKALGGHFPEKAELACYPPSLQACVIRRAQEGMSRFLFMYRLRKAIRARQSRIVPPTYESIPAAAWESSLIFKDWPVATLKAMLKKGSVDVYTAGAPIRYATETGSVLLIIIEGTIVTSKPISAATKGCSPTRNSTRVATIKGPCITWDTSILVEDAFPYAVHAQTRCKVAILSKDIVEPFVATLPDAVRKGLYERCAARRKAKMMRRVPHSIVRWSPLFRDATSFHVSEVFSLLEPLSFFKGEEVVSRHSDDQFALYFIVNGSVMGVGVTKKNNTWTTKVFASFDGPTTLGEKAVYFKERLLYDINAKTHCDLLVLKATSLTLMMALHRDLGRVVADGAFQVRGADASVRLLLHTPRSIPCVRYCTTNGLITDTFSRDLLALFKFRIFPPGEFITSSSGVVKNIFVIVSGQAMVKVSATEQWLIPHHVPFGTALLAGVRWRFGVSAGTSCEGWYAPLSDVVDLAQKYNVFEQMREASAVLLEEALARVPNTGVLELRTPQYIPELDRVEKGQHRSGKLRPIRKGIRAFGIISCPVRPPPLPVDIDDDPPILASQPRNPLSSLGHSPAVSESIQRKRAMIASVIESAASPSPASPSRGGAKLNPLRRSGPPTSNRAPLPWEHIHPLKEVGSLRSRTNTAVTEMLFNTE